MTKEELCEKWEINPLECENYLLVNGSLIHKSAKVHKTATIGAGSLIDKDACVCEGTILGRDIYIGEQSYVAKYVKLCDGVRVGGVTSIGLLASLFRMLSNDKEYRIIVGRNTWIGNFCSINNSIPDNTEVPDGSVA